MPKYNQQGLIGLAILSLVLLGGLIGGGVYIANRNASDNSEIKESKLEQADASLETQTATSSSKLSNATAAKKIASVLDDNFREQYMGKVAYIIDQYHRKNFKQGADGKFTYQLPESLDKLDFSSIGIDLDPNVKQFITTELKYITPANEYLLCAKFDKPAEVKSAYVKQKVSTTRVSQDYQCFEMGTFVHDGMVVTTQTIPYSDIKNYDLAEAAKIPKSTTFADPNIATAEAITAENGWTNVYYLDKKSTFTTLVDYNGGLPNPKNLQKETGTINFPFGFFSSNPAEWGFAGRVTKIVEHMREDRKVLVPTISPLQVRITFKNPIKLSSISNLFTNCQHIDCYTWEATGLNTNNQTVKLVEPTAAGFDPNLPSAKGVDSKDSFKEITIKTTRTDTEMEGTVVETMVWKKIKLNYK